MDKKGGIHLILRMNTICLILLTLAAIILFGAKVTSYSIGPVNTAMISPLCPIIICAMILFLVLEIFIIKKSLNSSKKE